MASERDVEPKPRKKVSLPVVSSGDRPRRAIDDVELGEGTATRSGASWVVLGALSTFAILVPLAMVAVAIARGADTIVPLAVLSITAFVVASFAGGFVIGRFGPGTGPREGAWSGALAGIVMALLAARGLGRAAWIAFVVLLVTIPASAFGAARGRSSRGPSRPERSGAPRS